MDKGLLFWILMLLVLVGGGWGYSRPDKNWAPFGFCLFLAIVVLGWAVFGPVVK